MTRLALGAHQSARTRSLRGQSVVRIGEGATVEGEATATDAILEVVAQLFEVQDAAVEFGLPALGDPLPVLTRRRTVLRQQLEDRGYLSQRNADPLCDPDQRDASEDVSPVAPLVSRRTAADDQALAFVEVQSRD